MRLFSKKEKSKKEEVKKEDKKEATPVSPVGETPKTASRLVVRPLLTEKASFLETNNQYVFIVDEKANKPEIKKEIERLFNVKVKKINIINKKRKRRMWRGRVGFSSGFKKTIVTVGKSDKIEVLPH